MAELVHEVAAAELDHAPLDRRQLDVEDRDDEVVEDVRDHALDGRLVGLDVDRRELLGDRGLRGGDRRFVFVVGAHRQLDERIWCIRDLRDEESPTLAFGPSRHRAHPGGRSAPHTVNQ